jgi:hypothetical protein
VRKPPIADIVTAVRDLNVTFARAHRFRRHLRRMSPTLWRLQAAGLDHRNVLAVLAVESFYRPRPLRAFEYATWMLSSLLGRRRHRRLSVGIAQIQLRHWRDLGLLESTRFSLPALAQVRDAESNYKACWRYLSSRGALYSRDPELIGSAYAGGGRRHYAVMLDDALSGAVC